MNAKITLGREGMGNEAEEEDFDRWVEYVCERIDKACGFVVEVDVRGMRDVQSTEVRHVDDEAEGTLRNVLADLWDSWCAACEPA